MDDCAEIREVIHNWAIWRDSGNFHRLLSCWHDDGQMITTWQQADAATFVDASRAAWERGVDVVHLLGGTSIELARERAIAQTRMTIQQRAVLDNVLVDVTCIGRFYDFFERRRGRWAILLRQPIYERDRLDPIEPCTSISLDLDLLDRFPVGYRHLGYLQTKAGMTVTRDLPGLRGPIVEALYARGAAWLAGNNA